MKYATVRGIEAMMRHNDLAVGVRCRLWNTKLKLKNKINMENNTSTNHENGNDANRLLCDVAKVMIENKIRVVKQKIEHLADRHEFYMGISSGGGSRATEIIEKQQEKLWKLFDKLKGNIA